LLVEQFTGQACPNCPGGAKAMAEAIDKLADPNKAIWVAHHTYYEDEFSLNESAVIAQILEANFAPACNINRVPRDYGMGTEELIWHPGYATKAILEAALVEPGLATIELDRTFNVADSTLTVVVKGNSLLEVTNVTVLVKQSGIVARQSSGGNNYQHNNAPRAFLTEAKGDALTLDNGNFHFQGQVLPMEHGQGTAHIPQ
jgi:hypothetical protein